MPIRILDAATVGRIAAGEVVERPSSVVKELVENALDAGASAITVELRGGGIDYLRVTDNGCGIEPNQLRMAFENHATSKLQRAEQLDDIRTLGFRGEALPSIAAVSRIEMTTRAKGQESGMKLTMEGGQNVNVREAGCPQGTTIVMRDLFFNVPVRRAFLKKPAYEGGLVSDAVSRLLLGNPKVSMRFISGGSTLFHSFGDGKLRHAVFAIYGRETAEGMVEMDASEGGARIYGLIGVGELAKASRAHELFFINGRSVRCPLLTRALEAVCRSRVTVGMYPMCVLNLVVPPTSVDVNVHPNKLEVRFRDEEMMRAAAEKLIARAFEGERVLELNKLDAQPTRVARKTELRELPLPDAPSENKEPEGDAATQPKQDAPSSLERGDAPISSASAAQEPTRADIPVPAERDARASLRAFERSFSKTDGKSQLREDRFSAIMPDQPLRTIDTSGEESSQRVQPKPEQLRFIEEAAACPRTDAQANCPAQDATPQRPAYRVIGTAFKTYILVEVGDALMLIDQHAAHERLQYERLMARAQEGTASQQLLTPLVLSLSAREMAIVTENQALLAEAGYLVEPFGARDLRVTAVPFVLGKAEIRPLFLEMLQTLTQIKTAALDARREQIMQMACKSAVKGGDALSASEIEALISQMLETDAPPTCPHGRPVFKTLTRRELEKMFRRIQ